MIQVALAGIVLNSALLFFLNERGEVGAGGDNKTTGDEPKTFTQEQLDAIIKERLSRTKEQYKDYDELKKFREEAEKQNSALTLKQQEDARQYEEAKKTYLKQIEDREALVKQKDSQITDMKIGNALSGEISRQNGYVEEALALMKSNASIDSATGEVRVKGKDSNGIETMLTVEQAVKSFLESRPHLVKAAGRNGGNTPPGNGGGENRTGAQDLKTLNDQYAIAIQTGDRKRAGELNQQIKAFMAAKRSGA